MRGGLCDDDNDVEEVETTIETAAYIYIYYCRRDLCGCLVFFSISTVVTRARRSFSRSGI